MGVYISKVTSCSGTALTLDAATAAETGSIRTCSSAQGTCTPATLGTCNATTFTCTGTGQCTGGVCTKGKNGIPCAVDADCNLDCATDLDCAVCTAGNVGFHCLTDHACSCLFGAPLAVPNTTVANASTCVINTVGNVNDTSSAGTADCALGASSTNTPLNSEIFLTGDLMPKRCSASTTGGAAGFGASVGLAAGAAVAAGAVVAATVGLAGAAVGAGAVVGAAAGAVGLAAGAAVGGAGAAVGGADAAGAQPARSSTTTATADEVGLECGNIDRDPPRNLETAMRPKLLLVNSPGG